MAAATQASILDNISGQLSENYRLTVDDKGYVTINNHRIYISTAAGRFSALKADQLGAKITQFILDQEKIYFVESISNPNIKCIELACTYSYKRDSLDSDYLSDAITSTKQWSYLLSEIPLTAYIKKRLEQNMS